MLRAGRKLPQPPEGTMFWNRSDIQNPPVLSPICFDYPFLFPPFDCFFLALALWISSVCLFFFFVFFSLSMVRVVNFWDEWEKFNPFCCSDRRDLASELVTVLFCSVFKVTYDDDDDIYIYTHPLIQIHVIHWLFGISSSSDLQVLMLDDGLWWSEKSLKRQIEASDIG